MNLNANNKSNGEMKKLMEKTITTQSHKLMYRCINAYC